MMARKKQEPALLAIEYRPMGEILPALRNARGHDIATQKRSYERFGMAQAIIEDERTGRLLSGHGRLIALEEQREAGDPAPERIWIREDGEWMIPVQIGVRTANDDEAEALILAYNRIGEGLWEEQLAQQIRAELEAKDPALLLGTGFDPGSITAALSLAPPIMPPPGGYGREPRPPARPTLAERFLVPPFSVLDARQGYWLERKRQWLSLGIQSEEGRPKNLLKMSDTILAAQDGRAKAANRSTPSSNSGNDPAYYYKKQEAERLIGRPLSTEEFEADWYEGTTTYTGGTSIFDPVLCELAYRWWCPPGGRILDPFAGGSVRGVVAAGLGLTYTGIDLRPEQVEANRSQWAELSEMEAFEGSPSPLWIAGDSLSAIPDQPVDFLFSCPPYFDLEGYSEDPADLSARSTYEEFLEAYRQIIAIASSELLDDRFACFVVGEIRGPDGIYRDFVPDTIRAFEDAGLRFYNEAILITPIGSAALRAARIFQGGRKLAKSHQNVLCFVKGDWKRAHQALGPIEVPDLAEMFGEGL